MEESLAETLYDLVRAEQFGWEKMVPEKASAIIKERHLFGYKKPDVAVQAL